MQTRLRKLFRSLFLSLVFLLVPDLAFAHATPILYSPAASSVLPKAPAEVQIHFSERIEPRVSSITALGPDGSRVDLADSEVDRADPRVFRTNLKDAGNGTYTVSWQVISADDGHFSKGAYVFSVGTGGPVVAAQNGGFQTVHSSSAPEAVTLAIELVGEASILGALIVLVFIWRPIRKHFSELVPEDAAFMRRFQILFSSGCVMALAGGIAYLIYKTNELATLQESSFAAAWGPFIHTTSALYTIYRLLGVAFLLITCLILRKQIFSSPQITNFEYASFVVLALIDFARARVSHAAASPFAPALGVLMNFVHLLFKDVWIGGIIALVALLSPLIRNSRSLRGAAFALTRFSRITSVALGVAGVTGVYVIWLHLKGFSNILTTDWGKTFASLSVFAALLLLFRLFHQLYCEPRIIDAIQTRDEASLPRIFSKLGCTLPAEMAIGIAILAVTSLLIITTPPLAPHYSFARSTTSQRVVLSLTQQPDETGKLLVTVQDPANKAGANVKNMVVALTNQVAGIGPILAPLQERFAGGFVFSQNLLSPPGNWTVNITAQRPGAYDAAASFNLDYPKEIAESDARAEDRTFGSFEVTLIVVALFILAASILLYRRSTALNRLSLSAQQEAPASATLSFAHHGAWIPPLLLIAIVLYFTGGIPALSRGVLESSFEQACENASVTYVWHESVPERDGQATSDLALPGCTTGIGLGQYHFTDAREFDYFDRPAQARSQLAISPAILAANIPAVLTFTLHDNQGNPVRDLVLDHNRILHVVIASKDFSVFAHIHVEDASPVTPEMLQAAQFPVHYTFPKDGRYMVSVDFMERGYIFSDQFYLNVGDSAAMGGPGPADYSTQKNFDGYQVTFRASPSTLKAGEPATLDYHIEKDGKAVTDMEPYLAVPMHISIIREDLMGFLHTHGLLPVSMVGKLLGESIHASHLYLPDKFGPDIEATNFAFPSAGIFHVYGEFQVNGKVIVTQFTVKVE
jgi:methionine-rich copper-binding protein CopC/putative copper export protein